MEPFPRRRESMLKPFNKTSNFFISRQSRIKESPIKAFEDKLRAKPNKNPLISKVNILQKQSYFLFANSKFNVNSFFFLFFVCVKKFALFMIYSHTNPSLKQTAFRYESLITHQGNYHLERASPCKLF
jgi:hypothetical protein